MKKNIYLLAYMSLASYVKSLLSYLEDNKTNFQKEKMMDYIYLIQNTLKECDQKLFEKDNKAL